MPGPYGADRMTAPAAGGTIPALLEHTARQHPRAWAIAVGGHRITYSDLLVRTRRAAGALIELGVAPADRVAVWGPNSAEWIEFALAALAAGAVLVPLSARSPIGEITNLIDRAGCSLAAAVDRFRDARPAASLAKVFDGPVVTLGADRAAGTVSWAELALRKPDEAAVEARLRRLGPGQPSHILFTSGSTGMPKAVALRHGAMVATTRAWVDIAGLRAGDRYPIVNPLAHIGGFKTGLVATLMTGATSYPLPVFDAPALLDLITTERLTVIQGPPTVFQELISQVRSQGRQVTSLRVAVTGSAGIAPELVRGIKNDLGARFVITAYGLTENTGVATMTRRNDPLDVICETSGRAVDGVQVRVAGVDGAPQPPGHPGEILVAGAGLMDGYVDDETATAEVIQDGWLRTGDVGWLDERGNLHMVDRLKDIVIVGGFNVYPAEVERVLTGHDDVGFASVVGLADPRLGEVPVAFVVPAPGKRPDAEHLLDWCSSRLANYKVPRRLWLVDSVPYTPVGKSDKAVLRAAAAHRTATAQRASSW